MATLRNTVTDQVCENIADPDAFLADIANPEQWVVEAAGGVDSFGNPIQPVDPV